MQTIEFPSLAETLATLPAEGVARHRQLYRLVDLQATSTAAAALRAAAQETATQEGVLARATTSADGILNDGSDAARDRLADAVISPAFAPVLRGWMREMREVASAWPASGACTLATAFKVWSLTFDHFRTPQGTHQSIDELVEALAPLIAARCFVMKVVHDATELNLDLAHVYAARASALSATKCAELIFGYRRHLAWDAEGCASCYVSDDLDDLEAVMPGIASGARTSIDIIEADGSHPAKRGPCARFDGLEAFMRFRNRLDACLTGVRLAKDRAAVAIAGRAS